MRCCISSLNPGSLKNDWAETQRDESRKLAHRCVIKCVEMEHNRDWFHSILCCLSPWE